MYTKINPYNLLPFIMTKQKTAAKSSARDVFAYLLMIIMLYIGVFSFIAILWQYINITLPDPLEFYYSDALGTMRVAISCLLIVWPVFLWISWVILRDIRRQKEKFNIWIRKWLLYLTLFIAALTIIIDLITLVNNFLGGELTTRIGLKALVILIVAIIVLSYYFWDLKRDPAAKTKITIVAAACSSILIIGWIVAGFFIVGSPAQQRAMRFDEERVDDLSSIQAQILNYWLQKGELPESLDELSDSLYGYRAPTDPDTGEVYPYQKTGLTDFELCATFATEQQTLDTGNIRSEAILYNSQIIGDKAMNLWNHQSGTVCFERSIDPELYPPIETIK